MASLLTQDFFDRPGVRASIHQLADAESLVLFVGSGVSASQGLPIWGGLLRRLLEKAAKEHPTLTDDDTKKEFTRTLLKSTDPTIVGSIIRQLYKGPETFYEALKTAIYQDARRGGPRPASTFCRAVWELLFTRCERSLETLVVTTNYDDVLENALNRDPGLRSAAARLGIEYAHPIVSADSSYEKSRAFPIHHIHGYIPAQSDDRLDADQIVISARDYGRRWEDHWSYDVLAPHWDSQWLFVGMSFHDPHISYVLGERFEHAAPKAPSQDGRGPRSPIGVFSLQGQPWASLHDNVKLALARAEISRLQELDMDALPTLYFLQDAQFLREVSLRTRLGPTDGPEGYQPYVERRTRWSGEFAEKRVTGQGKAVDEALFKDIHATLVEIGSELERFRAHGV